DERIYVSAGARNLKAAIRELKRLQLDADYDNDPEHSYRCLDDRGASCLMSRPATGRDLWLLLAAIAMTRWKPTKSRGDQLTGHPHVLARSLWQNAIKIKPLLFVRSV